LLTSARMKLPPLGFPVPSFRSSDDIVAAEHCH
jgi:hypothetical protein